MFAFKIAFRFLRSSLAQTLLIVLGISVGVSVQVFIGSLIGGLQNSLVETTIGNRSQITIASEEYISSYLDVRNEIIDVDGIKTVSFAIDAPGALIKGENTSPILMRGLEFEFSEDIYELNEKLVEGTLPDNDTEVLIGLDLLEELGLKVGDTVNLSIPLIGDTDVIVSGVYDFNVQDINNSWIITNLETAQNVLNMEDVVSSIEIQLSDVFEADTIALEIGTLVSSDFEITNWIDSNQELLSGLKAQGSSSLMIQVFVTISVVLGIASVLAITVVQKSRQIGILKAMGVKDRTASLIFLSQGFILGVLGAIGGLALGLFLTFAFTTFALGPDGNPVVPLLIEADFIALSGLIAVVSASVASLVPARKSTNISIIEVIKNV
jgi:lipoprotein-releasing system permease protein